VSYPLRFSATPFLVCAFLFAGESIAGAQFDDLLRRIPPDATAIVVMDVKGIHQSPIAVRRHWGQKHEQAYMQSPLILPPEADRIVLAADVDASNGFETKWEMAVMSLTEPIQMRSVARAESGYLDKLNGLEVAWTPSNAYFVGFEEKTLGAMFPAARKDVSRWIGFAQRNKEVLISDYLMSAAKQVNAKTQIVLAIDLKDVIDPRELSEKLSASTVLKGNTRKAEQLFPIMLGIQGATLSVSLGDTAEGTLRVDFASDAAPFVNFARPMLFHALNNMGANIGELEKWTTTIDGNSITATGRMSDTQLRRVFSLLEIPSTKFSTLMGEDVESPGSADQVAKRSKTYYSAVNTLIEDLRTTLEDTRDNHAVWMERYARKVDRLPLLHVDKDLLDWGANVGETFRVMALSTRSSGIRTGVRKSRVYGNYQLNYHGTGGVAYRGNYGAGYASSGYTTGRKTSSVKTQIRTEERAKAKTVRYESWKTMEDATAAIRRTMTERYQVEF
jgi:hypothetical protein